MVPFFGKKEEENDEKMDEPDVAFFG